ncbi:PIR Superfamily Protein [Plasmodium ovale curtisi]|uniref:PIR Superfamily Protein n=2 Tax=Plasmodium ovale curtisi TaxID=864141 RepID=A0A1A8WUR3_PLAOA|nr:PIR Superfamily Protein [Plasmodium ovale curtisi]
MPCKKQTDKYMFCTNSHYYEALVQYVNSKSSEVEIEKNCDNILSGTTLYEDISAKDICKKFKFLYKSFSKYHGKENYTSNSFTDYDCDFLNYWLNDKLRKNVSDVSINVKSFYEDIKRDDEELFSKHRELDNYLYDIDPEILENMKLLYELYDNAGNIINIMKNNVYENEQKKSCSEYTMECDENYRKAMDRCINSNVDYYNALKFFKGSYEILKEPNLDESNTCNSDQFLFFPKYDPVLEANQRRIMTFKIISAPLMLPFVIPLLYKYTPLGPFLRTKVNLVKERWLNPDENGRELLQMSTDTEDNISVNEEYIIGYYPGTD